MILRFGLVVVCCVLWVVSRSLAQPGVWYQSSDIATSSQFVASMRCQPLHGSGLLFATQLPRLTVAPLVVSADDGVTWKAAMPLSLIDALHDVRTYEPIILPGDGVVVFGETSDKSATMLEWRAEGDEGAFRLRSRDNTPLLPSYDFRYLGQGIIAGYDNLSTDTGRTWMVFNKLSSGELLWSAPPWHRCDPIGMVRSVGNDGRWFVANMQTSTLDSTDIPATYGDLMSVTHGPTIGKLYRSFRRQRAIGLVMRRPSAAPWKEITSWVKPNGDTLPDPVPLSMVSLRDSAIAMTFRDMDSLVVLTNDTIRYVDIGTRGAATIIDVDDLVLLLRHDDDGLRRVTLGSVSELDIVGTPIDAPVAGLYHQSTLSSIVAYHGSARLRWDVEHDRWLYGGLVYDVHGEVASPLNFFDLVPGTRNMAILSSRGMIHVPVDRYRSLVIPLVANDIVNNTIDHVERGRTSVHSVDGSIYIFTSSGVSVVDTAFRTTTRLGILREPLSAIGRDGSGRVLAAGRRLHRYDAAGDRWDTTSIGAVTDDPREAPSHIGRLVTTSTGTLLAGRRGFMRYDGTDSTRPRSGGILRSTDAGDTWTRVTPPDLGEYVYDLTTDSDGTLWATMANMTEVLDVDGRAHFFRDTIRILRSTDAGSTWQVEAQRYLSLTSFDERTFAISSHPTASAITITWPDGIAYRRSPADPWRTYDDLPFGTTVNAARFGPDGLLYIATQNGIVYRTDITGSTSAADPWRQRTAPAVTATHHTDGSSAIIRITSTDVLVPSTIHVHDLTGRHLPATASFVSDHVVELRIPHLPTGLYVISGSHTTAPFATTVGIVR